MTNNVRAMGIDFYQAYQPNYVHQDHHSFVNIKLSHGGFAVQHSRVWEQAKDVPIKIGYGWMRSGVSAEAHARALLEATDQDGYHPDGYMLDFERYGNSPSMKFGQTFKETIEIVKAESGKPVLKYSNRSTIEEWLLAYGQYWVKEDADWVIAQYVFNRDAWKTPAALTFLDEVSDLQKWNPRLPAGFTKGWGFWQYSADGNNQGPLNGIGEYNWLGNGPAVDLQAFDGTHEQLLAYFNKSTTPTPTPEPVDPLSGVLSGLDDSGRYKLDVQVKVRKVI